MIGDPVCMDVRREEGCILFWESNVKQFLKWYPLLMRNGDKIEKLGRRLS
jgi:hypothetical protein